MNEQVGYMNNERPTQGPKLDEALARARAAFVGKSDDDLLDEVAQVVEQARAAKRDEVATPASA